MSTKWAGRLPILVDGFQSLIGRMSTLKHHVENPMQELFQSLIGRMSTEIWFSEEHKAVMFQSLIGRMSTLKHLVENPMQE
jgi:hypothetical protein